jgi:hypothetical protein
VLRNNDVYNPDGYEYSGLSAGTGDISSDPRLVDKQGGNHHLTANSPCIDTGWSGASGIPLFDVDGQGRTFNWKTDIGMDEYWAAEMSIPDVKFAADGASISGTGSAVTASFDGFFYIEADNRSCGIRVQKTDHGVSVGQRVDVVGTVKTNADAEHFIDAVNVASSGSGEIAPLAMSNTSLGGGAFGYQTGVWGWEVVKNSKGLPERRWTTATRLSTIGLLVSTYGTVKSVDSINRSFVLDDGSGNTVKCLTAAGTALPSNGSYVAVAGISSCEKVGTEVRRLVRLRTPEDVSAL